MRVHPRARATCGQRSRISNRGDVLQVGLSGKDQISQLVVDDTGCTLSSAVTCGLASRLMSNSSLICTLHQEFYKSADRAEISMSSRV